MKLNKGQTVHSGKETFKDEIPDDKAVKLGIKKPVKVVIQKEDK